jgi:hypothetical protein
MSKLPADERNAAMAINIENEKLITLTEATKLLPLVNGKRIHVSTLWRWCRKGSRGIALEFLRVGSKIVTSYEALQRFSIALAELDDRQPGLPAYKPGCLHNRPRSEQKRQREIEKARAILVRAKIIQAAPQKVKKT